MQWRGRKQSRNIDDRRGQRRPGGFGLPIRVGRGSSGGQRRGVRPAGGGIGLIIFVLVAMYFGVDPSFLLQQGGPLSGGTQVGTGHQPSAPAGTPGGGRGNDEMRDFVAVVLGDTEETWHGIFGDMQRRYQEPVLVLFEGAVRSACGMGQSAMGPFYCSGDHKVYIDLSFFSELDRRFGAPGDFAQAYVIAHEVGHHVQALLGTSTKVHQAKARLPKAQANELSVKLELQADCYAGLWAQHAERARDLLESGDIEEGLRAATAIGDDTLQKQAQGYVVPESFTHGSSEQRVRWFKRGLQARSINDCNTFDAPQL